MTENDLIKFWKEHPKFHKVASIIVCFIVVPIVILIADIPILLFKQTIRLFTELKYLWNEYKSECKEILQKAGLIRKDW